MQVNNIKGFSLIGLMASVGLMGGLVLILAQLSQEQISIQKKVETEIAIGELYQKITRLLQDQQSCMSTVGSGTILTPGVTRSLNSIKNKSGEDVIVKNNPGDGTSYSNGLLRISSLEFRDITVNGSMAVFTLHVTFEKMSKAIKGENRVTKKFPLAVELNPGNQALYCTSHIDASLSSAKKELCAEVGGIFDENNQTCSSSIANKRCPEGQFMVGFDNNMNLACTPPGASAPFEVGKNCYLLTTYNNGNYLGVGSGSPWILTPGNNPIGTSTIWQLELQDTGGYSTDFIANHKARCVGDNYTDQFRTTSQTLGEYRFNLIFHYCCR